MQNSYKKLKTLAWDDVPCVITGAGPSLINYDFRECNNCHCISVNSSIIKHCWSSFEIPGILRAWVSNDSLCRKWSYFDKVLSDNCKKIVRDSWSKYEKELDNFLYFSPRNSREDVFIDEDDGLAYNSSVPTSVDLAIKLGFKKIYLLGIDHHSVNNKTHFWQFLPANEQPKEKVINRDRVIMLPPMRIMQPENLQKNAWNTNIEVFKSINDYAKSKGIEIYNVQEGNSSLPLSKVNFSNSNLINYGIKFMSILKHT